MRVTCLVVTAMVIGCVAPSAAQVTSPADAPAPVVTPAGDHPVTPNEDVEPRTIGRPGTTAIGLGGYADRITSEDDNLPLNLTLQVDVSHFLKPGPNSVEIAATNTKESPAGLAGRLLIESDIEPEQLDEHPVQPQRRWRPAEEMEIPGEQPPGCAGVGADVAGAVGHPQRLHRDALTVEHAKDVVIGDDE